MTDGQAAPVEGQAAPDAGAGQSAASWVDTLPDDVKEYVGGKGFKDPADVVNSYRNLEKLRGVPADRLLKLPEKTDDPAAMAEVYAKLGRPEAADKYTRALGDDFNDDVFKGIAAKAHELGLSDKQFAGLQEVTAGLAGQLQEQQDKASAEAFDAWKKQNGDGFNAAARAMAQAGVNEEQLAGILSGDKTQLYSFLAKMGGMIGEGQITQGAPGNGSFNMTPAQAKMKVAELFGDKDFMDKYTSRNSAIRAPAIARMEELQKLAAGGGN
jgi:hypothetical protein